MEHRCSPRCHSHTAHTPLTRSPTPQYTRTLPLTPASPLPSHIPTPGTCSPVFLTGNYCKLSRQLPQTAWVIDGARKCPTCDLRKYYNILYYYTARCYYYKKIHYSTTRPYCRPPGPSTALASALRALILLNYYTDIPIHYYTDGPLYECTTILLCHHATTPLCHYAAMLLYYYTAICIYRYTDILIY